MQRTCVKCGHVNPGATGSDIEACPSCGAVYAKAQATGARPVRRSAPQSGFDAPSGHSGYRHQPGADEDENLRAAQQANFVIDMRAQSLYPTVRALVKWGHWVMMFIAVLVAIGGLMAAKVGGPFALLAALGIAALIVLFSLAARELSLMLADLSDASVRMAARQAD